MSEVWPLPGYEVQALLGSGAAGGVWRARCLATGENVVLKRLCEDVDPAAVDALRRLDTPYVVRLREVVGSVLVLDHAPGGSLAALLARRGALEPGEVVTVAAPLAQALAAAHGCGLVHGAVSPSNVLFTANGMPLLADLGLARVTGERRARVDATAGYVDPAVAAGGGPDAAADVWALAAVCHHMLAGSPPAVGEVLPSAAPLGLLAPGAPRALVQAVEAALVADPAARPDAAALASVLRRAHAAAPVRLSGVTPAAAPVARVRRTRPVRPARPRERRVPQGVLLGLALVALLVLGGFAGWLSGRGVEQPATVAVQASVRVDWEQVLDDLDAARADAFASGEVAALQEVYAPGSPGLASDTALLQSLVDRRQTAHRLRHEVREVEVRAEDGARAALRVVDVLAPYEVRDASGAVVSRAPARREQAFAVELMRTRAGWRLVQVRPAG